VSDERISLIVNSRDDARWNAFRSWIAALEMPEVEIIRISDAKSMCEGYNRGIDMATGGILVFAHDDVEILTPDFFARVAKHLETHDVVGVAGTDKLPGSCCWWSSGGLHTVGQCSGLALDSLQHQVIVYNDRFGVTPAEALDGVLIAATRKAARSIRFDAEMFVGWHFYDVDFSYRASRAGLSVVVVTDVAYVHYGVGSYAGWKGWRDVFRAKHAATLPSRGHDELEEGYKNVIAVPSKAVIREVMEGTSEQARRVRASVHAAMEEKRALEGRKNQISSVGAAVGGAS
jgi:GT2 family glycosyltransferase